MATKSKSSVSSIKGANQTAEQQLPSDPVEQLSSIRKLLFGEDVARLELALEQQRKYMDTQLKKMEDLIKSTGSQLESQIKSAVSDIQGSLDSIHTEHSQKETRLERKLQDVGKRLTEFKSNTKTDLSEAHKELDQISKKIYKSLDKEVKQLTLKIDNTSKELSSNKADRKTLATLLESMATNLNQSQA
ncbi:hypothetical protein [Pleionea sediminis]|uniref:hypothetical protein n=1 Tax=Pleionea sediminis TaxID=2569479 RepID=UPI0011872DB7|nr:hypothetical protein [Pleionea sediminis]